MHTDAYLAILRIVLYQTKRTGAVKESYGDVEAVFGVAQRVDSLLALGGKALLSRDRHEHQVVVEEQLELVGRVQDHQDRQKDGKNRSCQRLVPLASVGQYELKRTPKRIYFQRFLAYICTT